MWCYWRPSSYFRRDQASVYRPHGVDGLPTAAYWLATPPWVDGSASERELLKRRFRTPESAMTFADTTWPDGSVSPADSDA